jgi:fibronectin-binding autotransporter adhesin
MSAFVDTLVISGDRILLFPATTRLTDVTINSFIWDANGATAGITDGSGAWLNSLRWNDNYGTNNDWVNGYGAIFGNGGTGGSVSVASPISVKYILFREYSGTYTLGTANQTISLLQGITKESASTGASTIISPIILTSNNTFFHDSVGLLTISGVISGPYSLTKTGSGVLVSVVTHTFSGTTNINGGILQTNNAATNFPNNISINGGILNFMAANLTKTLGDGAGQYRITGGVSGFSCSGNRTISGTYAMVWGSSFFNPLVLVFFHDTATSSSLVFQPLLNLNGDGIEQYRTIAVNANLNATISGSISNSGGNPIGIKKTGIGRLILSGNNSTVDGVYEVQEGTLSVGNSNAMGTRAGIILSGGTFDVGTYNLSSPAFPALTLLANSGINMNTGRLSFANSTADWDTPNVNLTLSGRISTKKLRFGTDNTGLSANQISRTSQRLSSGAIKPVTIDAEGYIATEYNDGLWNSTTGNWSNPAIWVDGVIANGQDATMKRTGTGNRTITVDSNFTIGYIHDVSNLTLVSSGGSKLKFDVSSGYPYYLNSNQYGTVSIQADLTGDNGLEFMQLGSCFLFGNNDYTGGSVFSNGMTLIGSANAIPDHGLVFNGGAIASYDI